MSPREEHKAYTCLMWPREGGGGPKLVWVLQERPDGWLVEEIQFGDTGGRPPKQVVFSSELWTRTEENAETKNQADIRKLGSWPMVRS